jgi:hypothetical protein
MNLHFKIDGSDLTRLARDLVLEKRWESAILVLVEGLQDFSHDFAYSVLSGKQKLEGNETDGISLVQDDSIEYINELQSTYGHYYFQNSKWYVPYAIITSFDERDISYMEYQRLPSSSEKFKNNGWKRALYYANNPKSDLVISLNNVPGTGICLFEIVSNPPIWMINQLRKNTPQSSYDHYTKHHEIELRGATEKPFNLAEAVLSTKIQEPDQTLESKTSNTQQVFDLTTKESLDFYCGWILRDGKFYGCGYNGHTDLANEILRQIFGLETSDGGLHAENRGWIKIGYTMWLPADEETYYSTTKQLTQAQRDTLYDWCSKHNKPYPNEIDIIK